MAGNTSQADFPEAAARLLEAIAEPWIVVDRGGTIVAANRGARRLFVDEDLAGRALGEIFEPRSEPIAEYLRRCFGAGDASLGAMVHRGEPLRIEGVRWVAHAGASPLALLRFAGRTASASRFIVLNQRLAELGEEVERRARAEAELAAKVIELARVDRDKNRFLAVLSHELRNPLAPIRTLLHVMRVRPDPGTLQRNVVMMERHVDHLVRLVDDLLDLSRIETGKIRVHLAAVELGEVIELAASAIRARVEAKGQALRVEAPAGVHVLADAHRLRQVIGNLLHNACKFTPAGGTLEVTVETTPEQAIIHVRDTGPGVPEEFAARIFTFFAQAQTSHARADDGLGLGLALARTLIELQGGSIRLANSKRGAHFVVSVPLAGLPEAQAGSQAHTPAASSP